MSRCAPFPLRPLHRHKRHTHRRHLFPVLHPSPQQFPPVLSSSSLLYLLQTQKSNTHVKEDFRVIPCATCTKDNDAARFTRAASLLSEATSADEEASSPLHHTHSGPDIIARTGASHHFYWWSLSQTCLLLLHMLHCISTILNHQEKTYATRRHLPHTSHDRWRAARP
jgi:hypothetical protein